MKLYRGVKTLYDRDQLLFGNFQLDENGEIDFATSIDVAKGYGFFVVSVDIPDPLLFDTDAYSVSDKDQLLDAGYAGVRHFDQVYLFDLELLADVEVECVDIAGNGVPDSIVGMNLVAKNNLDERTKSSPQLFANSSAFDNRCDPSSAVRVTLLSAPRVNRLACLTDEIESDKRDIWGVRPRDSKIKFYTVEG